MNELITQEKRPSIAGTIFKQLANFNTLYDYHTSLARKYGTCRLVTPTQSEVFIFDPVNVEHVLKTKFSNYCKGLYSHEVMKDLFGDGIFTVDGDKWRHQRKLASHEFSTKVLRDFSSLVFFANATKLVEKVSDAATSNRLIDLQEVLMKSTLDSIFKVGFGIELNSLSGSDEGGIKFAKTFNNASVNVFWRFGDPIWKIKREIREPTKGTRSLSIDEFMKLVTEDVLDSMQYLQAALAETLRIYPPVASDRKSAVNDDILPDGFKVKKGDGIVYAPYAMGRMTFIWGEDAEDFRPERWIQNGVFQAESPFKYTAFQVIILLHRQKV
ncbi:hypothetical protein GIB67_035033 [Kingdonia uniflora]|uniref:Cytochrome P450 n=1 Tax=Kingdonia uniflora TaxID=39325 RepID=A0A7J7L1R0_9MAGN|nr:hypothetical protein GIB67_035033 [Kingdonia uniflora]